MLLISIHWGLGRLPVATPVQNKVILPSLTAINCHELLS